MSAVALRHPKFDESAAEHVRNALAMLATEYGGCLGDPALAADTHATLEAIEQRLRLAIQDDEVNHQLARSLIAAKEAERLALADELREAREQLSEFVPTTGVSIRVEWEQSRYIVGRLYLRAELTTADFAAARAKLRALRIEKIESTDPVTRAAEFVGAGE
jgi:hypothetical protein